MAGTVMPAKRAHKGRPRLQPGQEWSDEFPEYIKMPDGRFRKPSLWRGKSVNHYFVLEPCVVCGKASMWNVRNQKSGFVHVCSLECQHIRRSKPEGHARVVSGEGKGYIQVKSTGHPYANNKGAVAEHRLVIEELIGRPLVPGEVVHHIDMNRQNNHPENLILCYSNAEHHLIHGSLNKCVAELMELGVLKFDPVGKAYFVDDDVLYRPDEVPGTRCTPKKYWLDDDSE